MAETAQANLLRLLNNSAEPLSSQDNYASLLKKIDEAQFVLIGEATHGTHEFYQTRAEITKQLITQQGFNAVAIEGDWPAVYQINRYLQGAQHKNNWEQALDQFDRFPIWMWRNTTIPPFLCWLREYNDSHHPQDKVGFFGLDLYSMYHSMQAVIDYLSTVDPEAAKRAMTRYNCFDNAAVDPQKYGYLTTQGVMKKCVQEVTDQLRDLQENAYEYLKNDSLFLYDEFFYATQNARVVKNAELYYRSMFEDHISSWNIRDKHMAETLSTLCEHLKRRNNQEPKIVIWAHNSHVGDARATEMGERGELNLGQLIREKYDKQTYNIGFSTFHGTVTAADEWGEAPKQKMVVPGLKGSYEALFHQLEFPNFLLNLHQDELEYYLQFPRLQRAIGVIYRPETERLSHYFFTRLPEQFDSVIHLDRTTAVQPL